MNMDDLRNEAVSSIIFPYTHFFLPKQNFFDFAKKEFSELVYDIGSGTGLVSLNLAKRGHNCIAVDHRYFDRYDYPVKHYDSTEMVFETGSIIMFCRPCHSGFVEKTIFNALKYSPSMLVYVSLAKNKILDLGEFQNHFKLKVKKVGFSGENLYVWRRALNVK